MSTNSKYSYEIDYYRTQNPDNFGVEYFAPSIQSLKSAQNIVRRYERKRRAEAKRSRQSRGTAKIVAPALNAALSDNIIQFCSPVWARPSLRLVYSRHYSPTRTLSPAPHARRAYLQRETRRFSRYIRASTPPPVDALDPVVTDTIQNDMFGRIGVMALQGLAIVLGLNGLLVILALF